MLCLFLYTRIESVHTLLICVMSSQEPYNCHHYTNRVFLVWFFFKFCENYNELRSVKKIQIIQIVIINAKFSNNKREM